MAEADNSNELVSWERAEALMDPEPPNPSLIVVGTLPYPMEVTLEPFPELLVEPDYWPTKVIGHRNGVVPEVIIPYEIQVPLSELATGKKGIELIGKDHQSQEIDIPGSS